MIQLPSGIVLQVCRVIQLLVLWDRIRGQLSLLQWKIQDFDYRDSLTLPLGIHPFWDHNNLAINSNPMHTPPCHPCENLGSVCSSAQIFLPAVKPVSLVREEVEEEVVDVSTLPLPIHYSIMACVNFWPCRAWYRHMYNSSEGVHRNPLTISIATNGCSNYNSSCSLPPLV